MSELSIGDIKRIFENEVMTSCKVPKEALFSESFIKECIREGAAFAREIENYVGKRYGKMQRAREMNSKIVVTKPLTRSEQITLLRLGR